MMTFRTSHLLGICSHSAISDHEIKVYFLFKHVIPNSFKFWWIGWVWKISGRVISSSLETPELPGPKWEPHRLHTISSPPNSETVPTWHPPASWMKKNCLKGCRSRFLVKMILDMYIHIICIYIYILYHVYIVRSNSKDIYHKKLTRLSQMFLVNHSIRR